MENGATYGSSMRPLNIDALALSDEERADALVMRFILLADATSRAEKISCPEDWTVEERAAYDRGDTAEFSRLRGYTEAEIAQFLEFVETATAVDRKYGEHTAVGINHLIEEQTAPASGLSL